MYLCLYSMWFKKYLQLICGLVRTLLFLLQKINQLDLTD